MQGIYAIVHRETGRCYVGSTSNFYRRHIEHSRDLRNGKHHSRHLSRAYALYGYDAFVFKILEACDVSTNAKRIERENHWISRLDCAFNTAPVAGSVLGLRHTDETKQTMSEAQKLSYAERGGSPLKDRPRSEQARAAISAGKLGKSHAPEHRANLSASCKGRISPRKGVKLSDETKARISASKSGIPQDPAVVAHRNAVNTGKKRTEEQKKRMSEAKKGKKLSPEHRHKLSIAAKSRTDRVSRKKPVPVRDD